MNWRTKLIHSERKVPEGFRSLVAPVFHGSTTLFRRAAAIVDTWDHDDVFYSYGSYGTPTTLELAARIAELEGGYRSFVTPGGQSALILIYMACLSGGDLGRMAIDQGHDLAWTIAFPHGGVGAEFARHREEIVGACPRHSWWSFWMG